ncbi:MAG: hypothetical protein ACI4PQ_02940 [Butyricicoccaceae bacterium]
MNELMEFPAYLGVKIGWFWGRKYCFISISFKKETKKMNYFVRIEKFEHDFVQKMGEKMEYGVKNRVNLGV